MPMTYPHVRVSGSVRDRGRQYGSAVPERIARSIAGYEAAFAANAGWDWARVRREGRRYLPAIEEFLPEAIEEMRGIAEGAHVEFDDVLAINVRTEIMSAAWVQEQRGRTSPDGCTALGLLPAATAAHHTIIAQNWDWLVHTLGTIVVLEVDGGDAHPSYVTVVEAGLLAKAGMNAAGFGLAANFLLTERDVGAAGVPFHVLLRKLIQQETVSEALAAIQSATRASSGNFLIGHAAGVLVDVESGPGGYQEVDLVFPDDGLVTHANHFVTSRPDREVSRVVAPSSPFRQDRVASHLAGRDGIGLEEVEAALCDHVNFPASVCFHADPRIEEIHRDVTATSLIMDLDARRLLVADGNPCVSGYRAVEYADFLAPGGAGMLVAEQAPGLRAVS